MARSDPNISLFLDWCRHQRIAIDPRIQLHLRGRDDGDEDDVGVYAGASIPSQTTLVCIPKAAVLSARSCTLARALAPEVFGADAHLALALALHAELSLGAASAWHGYLQALPARVDIAAFWTAHPDGAACAGAGADADADADTREAAAWIQGTTVARKLRGAAPAHAAVGRYYAEVAAPALARLGLATTRAGFVHAYGLVSGRAFHVDGFHGLAMVPVADSFNHGRENHVHLETDYDVCSTCGSLAECVHDGDADGAGSASTAARITHINAADDTCEMVSNAPIIPHEEVLNTYGEHLTNAQLLVQYGFALDGNDNDVIGWDIAELPTPPSVAADERAHTAFLWRFMEVADLWQRDGKRRTWADSRLVYDDDDNVTCERGARAAGRATGSGRLAWPGHGSERKGVLMHFALNSEAKISHHLWLFCALLNLPPSRLLPALCQSADALALLRRVARVQLMLEATHDELDAARDDADAQGTRPRAEIPGAGLIEREGLQHQRPADTAAAPSGTAHGSELDAAPTRTAPSIGGGGSEEDVEATLVVAGIARTVRVICEDKAGQMHLPGLSAAQLGDAGDGIARHMTRARRAAAQALSERSQLESGACGWIELGRAIGIGR